MTLQPRARACAAIAALATLACAGCGGAGDEATQLTRAEYVAKVDAQCTVSNARTKRLNEESRRAGRAAENDAQLLRRLVPILERGYGQVRDNAAAFQAANPPPGDQAEVERIRKLYDDQAEIVRKLGAAAKRGDVEAFKALSEEQKDVVARARAAAPAYGFEECGSAKSDAP